MADMTTISTTMPEPEVDKIVALAQAVVDRKYHLDRTEKVRQVTRAAAARVLLRFALENERDFIEWFIKTEGTPVE